MKTHMKIVTLIIQHTLLKSSKSLDAQNIETRHIMKAKFLDT